MMNILEQEDLIKGLPDQVLMQQAQMPTGEVPQFLVVSEIQRRSDMRKRFQENKPQEGTVKDRIVGEAGMGIMGAMPPQGMPPQGMPPQMAMAPQMPQQMPQMPPQMPPQGIQQAMPPQMMSGGGIVRMANGGGTSKGAIVQQVLARNPNATMADFLEAGVTQEDVFSFLGSQENMSFDELTATATRGALPGPPIGRAVSAAGQLVPKGTDLAKRSFGPMQIPSFVDGARRGVVAGGQGLSGMFGGDEDAVTSGDLSLPSLPELSTAPQRGAGGRPFDAGGFGDVASGIASGVAEYNQAKRDSLSPSISAQDIDDAVAGVVTERAGRSKPPFGPPASEIYKDSFITKGFDSLRDGYGYLVDLDQRLASAANRGIDSFLGSFSNPYGSSDAVQYAQPPMVQTEEEMANEAAYNKFIDDQMKALNEGGPGPVIAKDKNVQTRGEEKQGDGSEKELLLEEVTVDRERKDLSGILSELVKTPSQDRSNKANDPTLDFSDLIADSRRQAMSNALIQLGAGIAGGDVSKGIAAAGQAATEGTQAARDLDMNRRLAEFKAGREDLRRQDEADRFAEELGLRKEKLTQDQKQFVDRLEVMREDITAKLGISQNANNREILDAITDAIPLANTQAERDRLARQRMFILRLLNQDFAKLLDESGDTGAGSDVDPAQFDPARR